MRERVPPCAPAPTPGRLIEVGRQRVVGLRVSSSGRPGAWTAPPIEMFRVAEIARTISPSSGPAIPDGGYAHGLTLLGAAA